MKKQLYTTGFLMILFGMASSLNAQEYVQKRINNADGSPSLVTFKSDANLGNSRLKSVLNDVLKMSPGNELKLLSSELDFSKNFRDEKYQQIYKGVPVEFSGYNVHYKGVQLSSMNGEVFSTKDLDVAPSISAQTAFDIAEQSVRAQKYMWEDAAAAKIAEYAKPMGDLVVLPIEQADGTYKTFLAYRFDIFAAVPMSRAYIYVDAHKGNILMSNAIMKHSAKEDGHYKASISISQPKNLGVVQPETLSVAKTLASGTAATRYSGTRSIETTLAGSNYILSDPGRGNGVHTYNAKKNDSPAGAEDFKDADNNWTAAEFDNADYDNAALDAHWGVSKTYDYFKETFSRNSYNNAGALLRSYVHIGTNYENAAWTGSYMVYGDGASMFSPLTAFDVTAHELGHGVCAYSAGLVYQRESGALNEALSDIWGAAVERTYAPEKQMWLIGEDITKVNPFFLRSMSNPKTGSPAQPDTYHGINWFPATAVEGCSVPNGQTNDNCGVHYNSGVLNHWFYILTEGKTGTNDLGKHYSVTGIGLEKAAKIVYRLETVYLTGNSGYMNARNFGIQAAEDLFGAHSAEAIATQDAFYAVGLGTRYLATPDTTAPTIPTNLQAYNTTGTRTTLEWNPSTDDNELDSYLIFRDNVQYTTSPADKNQLIVKGLTPKTTYSFFVKARDAWDNISDKSNVVTVTTLDQKVYCEPTNIATDKEYIKRVQLNTIDNTSTGLDPVEDFTYLSTNISKGVPYEITITPEWTGNHYSEGYVVYVDLNNDGVFDNATERLFTKAASQATPITGTITIPDTAENGPLRMRVMMRYSGLPTTACNNYTRGQVEDYTLNVGALGTADAKLTETNIYPNPVKEVINIQTKKSGNLDYSLFNTAGQLVGKGNTSDHKINAQKLTKGVYVLELKFQDGTKLTQKFIKE